MQFSIIIPTCDRNDLLARCLEHLAPGKQTLPSEFYEVIVSDDGRKAPVDERMRDQFPWVRWIMGPRQGPAANRNHGARHALASWLVFTDDDCIPTAGWLAAFKKISNREVILEGRTIAGQSIPPFFHAPINENGGNLWSCNFALPARLFFLVGGFDDRFPFPHLEDVDLRIRLRAIHASIQFIPEALVIHPPRPMAPAKKHALTHESDFYFAHKHGTPVTTLLPRVSRQLRMSVRRVMNHKCWWAMPRELARIAIEQCVILQHRRRWKEKYIGYPRI